MVSTSPQPPSRNWPIIIPLLVAAGGPPIAAAFAFAEQVIQHPWKAVGLWRKLDVMTMAEAAGVFDTFQAPMYNSRSMRGRETGGASI